KSKTKLNTDNGVWIEQFLTTAPRNEDPNAMMNMSPGGGVVPQPGSEYRGYNPNPGQQPTTPVDPATGAPVPGGQVILPLANADTNQISNIRVVCRAVDVAPESRQNIVAILEEELRTSQYFDTNGTQVISQIIPEGNTFSVTLMLVLKNPLKL